MIKPDINKLYRTQLSEKYFKNSYPEYREHLNKKFPDLKWQDKLYLDQHDMTEMPVCPVCGKPVPLISLFQGYRRYCCSACSNKDSVKQQHIQETMLKRYGATHALKIDKFRDKFKNTCIEKFGTDNPTKNKEILKKAQDTTVRLYGAHGSASPILRERAIKAHQQNRLKKQIIPNHIGFTEDGKWIIKCNESCEGCTDHTFAIRSGNYFDRMRLGHILCTKKNPIDHDRISNTYLEQKIHEWLKEASVDFECNNRKIISPKEIDLYIPSKHIGVECNGCFWHSDKNVPIKHQYNKWKLCRDQDIQLLTLWEDWFRNKPEIVKSLILSKLGIYQNKIGARKCIIKEVDSHTAQVFLDANHIQGACRSKIRLGLYKDDELVSLMCFNKRSRLSGSQKMIDEWELVRFCNKLNMSIVGGASKLFKFFIYNYTPKIVVSFASNDISDGGLYRKLGFEEGSVSVSYWYLDGMTRYHRSSFSKDAIIRKGWKDNKEGWTEDDVTKEHGLLKIWDSGTTKWIWKGDQKAN